MEKRKGMGSHSARASNGTERRAVMAASGVYFLYSGSNRLQRMWLREHPAVSKALRKM